MSSGAELLRLAAELRSDLVSAADRAQALQRWVDRLAQGDDAYIPAGLLHHFYTAIEAAARRAVVAFDGSAPAGPDSHARLLEASTVEIPGVRPEIFPLALREPLRELLDFRHLYRHGYGVSLDPERVQTLARRAVGLWPKLAAALEAIARFAEGCATKV